MKIMDKEKEQEKKKNDKMIDTYSYKGWLVSDCIFKRSMAVFGHFLIMYFFVMMLIIILSKVFGFSIPVIGVINNV